MATLSRYDAWIFFAVLFALIVVVGLVKHHKRAQIASDLLVFSILGGLGIGLWIACCWIMFSDPIYFLRTRFLSKTALQPLASSNVLSTYHDLWRPLHFFAAAALETLGPALFILALLATVSFLLRRCFKPQMLATLAILAPVALYVVAMYNSQLMLALPVSFPMNIQDNLFSVCLGGELVVPAAIFIATLIGDWLWRPRPKHN
jgi:hypothetical protein